MAKKIIITALLGTVLITGIIGWFVPIGIKAEYTGAKIYQSETVSKNDINVKEFSLFGRKSKVSDFVMEPAVLKGIDLEFDISADNMSTQLDINVIPVKNAPGNIAALYMKAMILTGINFPDMPSMRTGLKENLKILP